MTSVLNVDTIADKAGTGPEGRYHSEHRRRCGYADEASGCKDVR